MYELQQGDHIEWDKGWIKDTHVIVGGKVIGKIQEKKEKGKTGTMTSMCLWGMGSAVSGNHPEWIAEKWKAQT